MTILQTTTFEAAVQVLAKFVPRYLAMLCQCQDSAPAAPVAQAGGIGVQPRAAGGASFRFSKNLSSTLRAVLKAFTTFTSALFTAEKGRSTKGKSGTEVVVVPLGKLLLSPPALRTLISKPNLWFIVKQYLEIVNVWFARHKRPGFPKHSLDIVVHIQTVLWPLLQACYADVPELVSALCDLFRTLLCDHLRSLIQRKPKYEMNLMQNKLSKGQGIVVKSVQTLISVVANRRSPPDVMQNALRALISAHGKSHSVWQNDCSRIAEQLLLFVPRSQQYFVHGVASRNRLERFGGGIVRDFSGGTSP